MTLRLEKKKNNNNKIHRNKIHLNRKIISLVLYLKTYV